MHHIRTIVFNILSLALAAIAVIFIIENGSPRIEASMFGNTLVPLPLGIVLLSIAVVMSLAVFARMLAVVNATNEATRKAERNAERAKVSEEVALDKIKALESKIQTLETALENALERQQNTTPPHAQKPDDNHCTTDTTTNTTTEVSSHASPSHTKSSV